MKAGAPDVPVALRAAGAEPGAPTAACVSVAAAAGAAPITGRATSVGSAIRTGVGVTASPSTIVGGIDGGGGVAGAGANVGAAGGTGGGETDVTSVESSFDNRGHGVSSSFFGGSHMGIFLPSGCDLL